MDDKVLASELATNRPWGPKFSSRPKQQKQKQS